MATQKDSDSFETKVNNLVSTITRDDEGKIQMPDNTDEALAHAALTEIRRRDTQSALSKEKTNSSRLKAENEALTTSWEEDYSDKLTKEEKDTLDDLKQRDPDAWHKKLVDIKADKQVKFKDKRKVVVSAAHKLSDTASRQEILAAFNAEYPNVLTDDKLNNDIPPRYIKQLESGKVSYKEFLQNCADFLTKTRVIEETEAPHKSVDLSKIAGGNAPTDKAAEGQDAEDYKKIDW